MDGEKRERGTVETAYEIQAGRDNQLQPLRGKMLFKWSLLYPILGGGGVLACAYVREKVVTGDAKG